MSFPVLAIVGRPNVGKSALFNRIAGKQIALVHDREGVTRDRIAADCKWKNFAFTLMDTGGIGLEDASGLEKAIEREVDIALETATDVVLVVDGRAGLQILDEEIFRKLRKSDKRIYIAVNKLDSPKQSHWESEFSKLGGKNIWPISAAHGHGVHDLLDEIASHWTTQKEISEEKSRALRIAIVGKPNVGKSSLINALLQENRLIVSNVPGTTRDAVDVQFAYKNQAFCLVDTAGMRKRRRISDVLENAMTGRSAHTINRADVCVLVIDAESGVGEQDKKIAGLIQEAEKPCVILINKWDIAEKMKGKDPKFRQLYEQAVRRELFFAPYAEIIFASALERKNVFALIEEILMVIRQRDTRIGTGELNRILRQAMERQSPPRKGRSHFKLYYATQGQEPRVSIPIVLAFVNHPELFAEDYRRYLEQNLRKHYPCKGCPIKWILRPHHKK